MEIIASTQNQTVKEIRKLKEKKERCRQNRFLAEGYKCAEEAVRAGLAEMLILTEDADPALVRADISDTKVIRVTNPVMESLCEVKNPQPILAVVRRPEWDVLPEGEGIYVALENISDPQNLGTIIRTADAIGAKCVLLTSTSVDPSAPKTVRAAMGSLFHVPICVCDDFLAALRTLKNRGVRIFAGHLNGSEEKIDPQTNACVLIGNESRGLSDECAALADERIKIRIYGQAESLNAAVATGILLYRCKEGG